VDAVVTDVKDSSHFGAGLEIADVHFRGHASIRDHTRACASEWHGAEQMHAMHGMHRGTLPGIAIVADLGY
jgi:hypothetical protein